VKVREPPSPRQAGRAAPFPGTSAKQGRSTSALLCGKPGPQDDRDGWSATDDAEMHENGHLRGGRGRPGRDLRSSVCGCVPEP